MPASIVTPCAVPYDDRTPLEDALHHEVVRCASEGLLTQAVGNHPLLAALLVLLELMPQGVAVRVQSREVRPPLGSIVHMGTTGQRQGVEGVCDCGVTGPLIPPHAHALLAAPLQVPRPAVEFLLALPFFCTLMKRGWRTLSAFSFITHFIRRLHRRW